MNRGLILQGHLAKYTPFQLFDGSPKSVPVVFLRLSFEGIFDDADTPLLFDVRPLAQDLVLKIISEPVRRHGTNDSPVSVSFLQASITSKSNFLGSCAIDNGAFLFDVFSKNRV